MPACFSSAVGFCCFPFEAFLFRDGALVLLLSSLSVSLFEGDDCVLFSLSEDDACCFLCVFFFSVRQTHLPSLSGKQIEDFYSMLWHIECAYAAYDPLLQLWK